MLDTIAWQVCKALIHSRKLKRRIVSRPPGDFFSLLDKAEECDTERFKLEPRERPFVLLREVQGLPDS